MGEIEREFESYREFLHNEIIALSSFVRIYRRVNKQREDRLDEMNIVPAFLQPADFSLLSKIIIRTEELLSNRSQTSLPRFLLFLKNNLDILDKKELQRRAALDDNHHALKETPLSISDIEADERAIDELEPLRRIKIMHDKYLAHFDDEYFENFEQLSIDAPITFGELELMLDYLKSIVNKYSLNYDGKIYNFEAANILDIDTLIEFMHANL